MQDEYPMQKITRKHDNFDQYVMLLFRVKVHLYNL